MTMLELFLSLALCSSQLPPVPHDMLQSKVVVTQPQVIYYQPVVVKPQVIYYSPPPRPVYYYQAPAQTYRFSSSCFGRG